MRHNEVFKISALGFNAPPCSVEKRVWCPLNNFEVLPYVSSNTHTSTQELHSRLGAYFGLEDHLFHENPKERNQAE
jgi:hypothetical protein